MKLNKHTQLGLLIQNNPDAQAEILRQQMESIDAVRLNISQQEHDYGVNNLHELIEDKRDFININYLVKKSAMKMVDKIPLNDKFDLTYLTHIPNKKCTFLLGPDLSVRYYKTDKNVSTVFYFKEGDRISWIFLRIDLTTGNIILPKLNSLKAVEFTSDEFDFNDFDEDDMEKRTVKKFIQLLLFVELSELVVEILQPKQKTGTKKTERYLNESNSDIVIVDSKWNVISVRTEGFTVEGHWRFQPCGVGRLEREYIWIKTFEKHGYVRKRHEPNQSTTNLI